MFISILSGVSRNVGKGNVLSHCGSYKSSTLKFGYISCAGITSKANRDPNYKRKPPFPYKEKNFGVIRSWFDRTSDRFDDNSKIVVVDGPIAVGKTKFAMELAESLDMYFMPEANMDMVYINSYGFDIRTLNGQLPPDAHKTDEKTFCADPIHLNVASFQMEMFELRLSMYIDALAHVMNTGQGVVMVRNVYSDMVFAEAMTQLGYIRRQVLKAYYDLRTEIFPELLRPHLQIYLDIPVSLVQERIKARGNKWEINSKALTPAYLNAMEDAYKRKYLPEIEKHAELLIYDWSEYGDLELIVEDIERLDFSKYTVYDTKMKDWRFPREQTLSDKRIQYTSLKEDIMTVTNLPMFDCPELYMDGDAANAVSEIVSNAPGLRYARGFNKDMGDKGILFKTKVQKPMYPYYQN